MGIRHYNPTTPGRRGTIFRGTRVGKEPPCRFFYHGGVADFGAEVRQD